MSEDKKLNESSNIIKKIIAEGKIVKPVKGSSEFFMNKSLQSVAVASRLSELENEEGLEADMWVINACYYAMFFAATALLAKFDHKLKIDTGIHRMTYHALVYYFVIDDNKLEKHFMEEYKDAVKEAEELLQLSEEKADELVRNFGNEMSKRKIFTYDLGEVAERRKSITSLKRAKYFVKEIEKLIK